MAVRGARTDDTGYEKAKDGTFYWTLSLYLEADKVADTLGLTQGFVGPQVFRRIQRKHLPSLALANAVDPLMNDIADRETQGQVQEYLLSTADDAGISNLRQADARIRGHDDLTFKLPQSVSWTTEGVLFHAHPAGLDDHRLVRLRRFWQSHNNGALSYHLSFSHYYGRYDDGTELGRAGYDPATFYFLSMLQKLAAPKEYALKPEFLQPTEAVPDPFVNVFDNPELGIDPLDKIRVDWTQPAGGGAAATSRTDRFWPFVSKPVRA